MAEREGFEPSVEFPLRRFSNFAQSCLKINFELKFNASCGIYFT